MKKVLFIGYVWPEPSTTAAGHRMQQLLHAFNDFGYHITFGSAAAKSEYSLDLEAMGVEETTIQLNHSSFDSFIKELEPDMVVFDRFMTEEQYGWRVAQFAPQALRVLNTEDLHSLRKTREECHKKNEAFTPQKWKNHGMTLREAASIYRSDLSLMISSYEMELLQNELGTPKSLLMHLPFMLEKLDAKTMGEWSTFEERKDFVCVGNGKHAPNVDSIITLKNTIWPLIRKALPDAELHIYGAYLPNRVLELHKPGEGFHVMGWAKNLETVLQHARVNLAPLQFGAGIKGKLITAMQHGIPSITTVIGAEGMHGNLPWNGVICNDWNAFVTAAVEHYQNKEKWEAAQTNGVTLINTFYDKTALQKKVREQIEQLRQNLETHRSNNFIGRLAQHHSMASTKYMAKWIEEKNRG
ncbi:glycosyltransferase [Flagellimonas sp. CMM7]|uniref:glycosyltransferase n=1 Tax=Flagellimonas sp. CMM7 TaxID=2654676 RepID=UPI0013D3EE8F|nr:glycosyltransferase [Flagellimonas sp. CMM7]UII79635.1 glycosyltransferase family 4 protein [Flagellimonas sp. CMM7]